MVWQWWANVIAEIVRGVLFLLMIDEVAWAFRYHFPWWDDVMMPLSLIGWQVCTFVMNHTKIYRDALR